MPRVSIHRKSFSAPSSPSIRSTSRRQDDRPHYHSPQPTRKVNRRKLFYKSPRLELSDELLFPYRSLLKDQKDRWEFMSKLAGEHRQDATVLRLQRVSTPRALQMGTPMAAAFFVEELHLPIETKVAELPAWLDVIVSTFPNLRHLSLEDEGRKRKYGNTRSDNIEDRYATVEATDDDDDDDDDDESDIIIENSKEVELVRRLYIVYRLPMLKTLDGKVVTEDERKLSRPRNRSNDNKATIIGNTTAVEEENTDEIISSRTKEWVEQARAKVSANVTTPDTSSCLLDSVEEEEDEIKGVHFRTPERKRGTAEPAVEVDVNGLPLTATPGSSYSISEELGLKITRDLNQNLFVQTPPLLPDDQWEYASVESSMACEWSAACGGLSLPYFRKSFISDDSRERTKNRFHLKIKRESAGIIKPSIDFSELVERRMKDRLSSDPVMLVESTGRGRHQEMIFEARSQKRTQRLNYREPPYPESMPQSLQEEQAIKDDTIEENNSNKDQRSPTSSSSSSPKSSLSDSGESKRHSASTSLTSPFPMQFRIRATSPTAQQKSSTTDKAGLKVATCFNVSDEAMSKGHSPPPPPRITTVDMETIEVPFTLTRTQSSPSKLSSSSRRNTSQFKNELPPPGPSINRRKVLANSTSRLEPRNIAIVSASEKLKRRGNKWREKLSARNTSIIDNEDEEDDDESELSGEENLEINDDY